jgi:hypothetical protein
LNIDVSEVLRYLGYKNQVLNDSTKQVIQDCIEETRGLVRENYVYKYFDIKKDNNSIVLSNSNIKLIGLDIYEHLKDSVRCALMAVTIGSDIDFKIRYYEKIDLTKAIIMDACATAAVESLCDEVEGKIKEKALEKYLQITYRYSPGYGDLPIELQPSILDVLEAQKKIGLTVSDSFILLPRKSVTAIIGIQEDHINSLQPGCRNCNNYKYCDFRKEENYCGA